MPALVRSAFAICLLLLFTAAAHAQAFPNRPVKILVPFAAGGAVDIMARTIGQSLQKEWGQPVVIENRPGAGGIVASQALTQSPADGYTLIVIAAGHPLNQFFYPSLPYDTFADFTAITQIATMPLTINVAKDSPVRDLKELLGQARAKPGMTYGISGYGTSAHLAGELLNFMGKVKIDAVPYKSGTLALTAVIAGELPVSVNPMSEVMGQLKAGTVRVLAVSTDQRSPALPDVPTVSEQGIAGYACTNWFGMLAPKGLDAALARKLNEDVARALKDPAVVDYLGKSGATPVGNASAAFEAFMRAEAQKWEPVIKAMNIKL